MTVIGQPREFFKSWKFTIAIDSVLSAGFQSCSELATEVAEIQYYEGGSPIPDKSPGRQTFDDVTLARGAAKGDTDLYIWWLQVSDAAAGTGVSEPQFKRSVDIQQQDRTGAIVRTWRLINAWPKRMVVGAWDNEADENVIESVTLAYDRFELIS
jgi:phage tail-like protein